MFKLKHLLIVIILSMITSLNLSAKDDPQNTTAIAGSRIKMPKKTPDQKAKLLTDTINSVVGLSIEQYPKIYAANFQYITQKEALNKTDDIDMEALKAQMKAISKKRKTEIASVLTSEQILKWQTWKKNRKASVNPKMQELRNNKSTSDPIFDDISDM